MLQPWCSITAIDGIQGANALSLRNVIPYFSVVAASQWIYLE